MKVLLVEHRSLGDVLFATPAIRALARAGHEAAAWVAPAAAPLLRGNAHLRRLFAGPAAVPEILGWRADAAIVADPRAEAAAAAASLGIPRRIGRDRAALRPHLTEAAPPRPGAHEIAWVLEMVRALGVPDDGPRMDLTVDPAAAAWAGNFLGAAADRSVLLSPFVGAALGWQRWPLDRVAALGRALAADGWAIVVDAAPADAAAAAQLATEIGTAARTSAGETDVPRFVALAARAALVVTNDSAAHHVAAALGRPSVAIFGPTSPAMYGNYGPPHRDLRIEVPCGPCFRRGPDWPYRPETCLFSYRCLAGISVEAVLAACREALSDLQKLRTPAEGSSVRPGKAP